MWIYSLQFVAGKVRVDPFNLLYSKLLLAKESLFVIGAIFTEWKGQVISICSCFFRDFCLSVVRLA